MHLETDNDRRLRTTLYDKKDGLILHIVNFPFIHDKIPAAFEYEADTIFISL